MLKGSITHWTAGGPKASDTDRRHYHELTQADGTIVAGNMSFEDNIVTSDGEYAAHVRGFNTGRAGFAMCGMHGAKEHPFDAGPYPITESQFEAHCRNLAKFHTEYNIPVTDRSCITHAEVEPRFGVKQIGKWDLTRLPFKPGIVGAFAVGDYMRTRVKSYMTSDVVAKAEKYPVLSEGDYGAFVLDLQDKLTTLNYTLGVKDGKFGPLTKKAVLAFQSDNGLDTDGIVGPATWARLQDPRALPPVRQVNEDDLRRRGSGTVKDADSLQKVAVNGGGVAVIAAGADFVANSAETLEGVSSTLGGLQAIFLEYWLILAVLGIAGIVWFKAKDIKIKRLKDAMLGKNVSK